MADFKAICEAVGCAKVRTYIASGNAVFESRRSEAGVKAALEARLEEYAGKPVRVLVRTRAEMAAVLKANPFPEAAANRTLAVFLDAPPPVDTIDAIAGPVTLRARRRRSDAQANIPPAGTRRFWLAPGIV
jgi:uncharacterized protein (DUF1697 family)